LTAEARKDPKYKAFADWLKENGGKFNQVEYPCVFAGGVMGLAAKT
jgi:hypothetical protein